MINVRPWTAYDAPFVCEVRNHPDLQKWFRQDSDISIEQQIKFIKNDSDYNGQIIEFNGIPVGVCNVRDSGEFGVAILPEYQGKGIAKKALESLFNRQNKIVWSEVFVSNPALSFYLTKLKFRAVSVKERAYYKKDFGLVDVVRIERIS